MDEKYGIRINGTAVGFYGIDWEAYPTLLKQTENRYLIKIPARRCWVGMGTYAYRSPTILVLEKTTNRDIPNRSGMSDNYQATIALLEKDYTRQTRKAVMQEAEKLLQGN